MIKRLIIIFTFSFFAASAQETRVIDSLKKFIASAPDDSNKVNALYKLGKQYDIFSSKNHIEHFTSALNLAKKIGYKQGMLRIYNSLTLYLLYKEMYGSSVKFSFEYLDLLEELNLKEEKYRVYSLLGNLLLQQDSFSQARNYYHIVRAHRLETKNDFGYANSMVNLLILNMKRKDYDSALAYGFRAVETYKKTNNPSEMANALLGLSEALIKKQNLEAAEQKARESYDIYKTIKLDHGMCNAIFVLGQIYKLQNKIDTAITCNKFSLKIADSLNLLSSERDCYKALSELYVKKDDFEKAYAYQVLYKKYEDSLVVESQKGKMLEAEVQYDISKKEKLLLEQKFEIESQNKQRNYLLLGIVGIIVLLLISYRAYKQKKTASEIIEKQKELVEDKQKEILDSINYAKRIQNAILAKEEEIKKYLPQSFLLYKPKDIVAGDFYFFEVTDTHIFYGAADCTGHGVPGALMSVVCSNSLTRCVNEFELKDPGQILDKTRTLVVETLRKSGEEVKDGMDISLCAISKNDAREIKWAGANNPLWFIKNGEINELKADKQPIGLYDKPKPFTTHLLSLNKGDTIYLFTDGYADQFGGPKARPDEGPFGRGKKFKYKQLKELLISISTNDPNDQVRTLESKFNDWKGELDQVDDVCIIGIQL